MKNRLVNKYIICFFIAFISFSESIMAQSPEENLQKYWKYRERLKNFMISGAQSGCSIPTGSRDNNGNNDPSNPDQLVWNDSPWFDGYWIGTLAMEYELLSRNGYDVTDTKKELFNAIETLNRLDFNTEDYWCNSTGSLNGFTLEEDVHQNFHQLSYNGEVGADLLNSGWVPPPDGYRIQCMNSAFEQYEHPSPRNRKQKTF